jgi:hypothetical protein
LKAKPIYGYGFTVMLLIVHRLLGYRRPQALRYYRGDPVVLRLPDVARLSRNLAVMEASSVGRGCPY